MESETYVFFCAVLLMIKLTSPEHIKGQGSFKMDGLWVKQLHFDNPCDNVKKQQVKVEVVPFAYMDDGSRVFDLTRSRKILIDDAEKYLIESGDQLFLQAYFATEQSIAKMLTDRTDWSAEFIAPQGN